MRGYTKKRSQKAGLPPGSLVFIGAQRAKATEIRLVHYDAQGFEQRMVRSVEDALPYRERAGVTWVHIAGVQQIDVFRPLERFGVHPLVIEDILNTDQRTKFDDYGDCAYFVLKMLSDAAGDGVDAEQVSIVLSRNFVLSVEESPSGAFDSVLAMVEKNSARARKSGADYLAYLLLDKVVDNYFAVLEILGERIERLQDALVRQPTPETLQALHQLRREALFLRKSVWPLRDVIASLERNRPTMIAADTWIYLRDVYDHTIHIVDNVETFRETLSSMLDIYLSSVSYRMNEIVKVLTIITTIFMPLSFIAGVYGMNFEHMPELSWRWGYPAVLALMAGVAVYMLRQFRKKGWL